MIQVVLADETNSCKPSFVVFFSVMRRSLGVSHIFCYIFARLGLPAGFFLYESKWKSRASLKARNLCLFE